MNAYDHDLHAIATESSEVVRIERLTHHIQRIRESQDKMESSLSKMADAVARMALIEERQANINITLGRVVDTLEKVDSRVRALELAEPLQARSAEWVEKAVWGAAGLLVMAALAKLGIVG